MNSVLIIGAGWLGKKAGKALSETGIKVTGTTRSEEGFEAISEAGMNPVQLDITPGIVPYLPGGDVVIISVSPGRGEGREDYPAIVEELAKSLKVGNSQVIMFSSTSVYNGLKGHVDEDDRSPDFFSKNPILSAEGILKQHVPRANILRLGGLYGEDRHPVYHLQGRKNISDGDAPVNLIHSGDIISVIELLIKKGSHSMVLNVVCPSHPTKRSYYTQKAIELGLTPPEFTDGGSDGKIVGVSKLTDNLGFTFSHCDLHD